MILDTCDAIQIFVMSDNQDVITNSIEISQDIYDVIFSCHFKTQLQELLLTLQQEEK